MRKKVMIYLVLFCGVMIAAWGIVGAAATAPQAQETAESSDFPGCVSDIGFTSIDPNFVYYKIIVRSDANYEDFEYYCAYPSENQSMVTDAELKNSAFQLFREKYPDSGLIISSCEFSIVEITRR